MERRKNLFLTLAVIILAVGSYPSLARAQEAGDLKIAADTVWTLITAFLVFWMNAGFALVESGFCQQKNCVNILAKNFIVFAVSSVAYWILGYGLMFGDGNGFLGQQGLWFLGGADNSPATGEAYQGVYGSLNWTGVPLLVKFFFQLVFAGTAATIVSGAVAERIKFVSFILFSFIIVAILYPITGHWIWGGGWLAKKGFFDFAGSTVVHSVGGWAALMGVLFLGPRIGKYRNGKVYPVPGHNMSTATLGCLILWLGWFGFNPGSTMAADWAHIGHIAVTTNMAGAVATLSATVTAWIILGKPDLGMILNGTLAGLVAVTAPCAFVSVGSSVVIGLIAGILVVLAVIFFDKIRVDDPVGALSVHLVNGVWGTIAVGLFAEKEITANTVKDGLFFGGGTDQLIAQLTGVLGVALFTVVASAVAWLLIKLTVGLRVSEEEELEGLDFGEHGNRAYPDFQTASSIERHS
ncbi:MAG: ammonium transporter [Deltaproteobacteria bacterium]|nr:ammonium transporter [Deltaproteobacteria bacterium]